MEPAQRLLEEDLQSPEYLAGADRGLWGRLPATWPSLLLWLSAPPRAGAPDRYHILLDATGYRLQAPTGTFFDPETNAALVAAKRPKGIDGSRFAKVFRTDWENGRAFYHPYDRFAAGSHPEWATKMPHKVWTPNHTIVDYVEEFHGLLQSEDYRGV